MGCLKNIVRSVVLTLAVVGFLSIGGKDLISGMVQNYFHPSQEKMMERAMKVGDFSKINEEFEIEKAAGIMGYNAVVAEHKASGQKMFVVDTKDKNIITADDIKSENAEEKLQNALKKIKYQALSVEDLKVTKHGTLSSYGTEAPYVKFEAKVKKLPIGDVGGIISVVNTNDGEQRILISANEKSKYSQLISDEFFRKIK
ncbi:hypothetical protein J6P92_01495 [bacterium]|nr:hypothetical protein [bacterium]